MTAWFFYPEARIALSCFILPPKYYGMRALTVTLDNGYLSWFARTNISNALAQYNADHLFYHMNRSNSSELFRIFTEITGDFCNACMRGSTMP